VTAPGAPLPNVTVAIVHWLNLGDTVACLRSLAAVNYPRLTVILVNNGSSDFAESVVRQALPYLQVIQAQHNMGFAAANNLAVARALRDGAEFVFLLNNDTVVRPDVIRSLLRAFEHPGVGIAGPIVTYYDHPDRIWSAGGRFSRFLGYSLHPHTGSPVSDDASDRDVDFINGCALMAKREVFEVIDGLWEPFFLYFEEVDFCLRAARAGLHCRLVSEPLVRHKVSASGGIRGTNALTPNKAYYFGRNPFWLLRRNNRGLWRLTALFSQFAVVLPYYLWRSLRARNVGVMKHYLVGMWDGLRGKTGMRGGTG
jgi:GT2 family glycosyltransferase